MLNGENTVLGAMARMNEIHRVKLRIPLGQTLSAALRADVDFQGLVVADASGVHVNTTQKHGPFPHTGEIKQLRHGEPLIYENATS